MAVAIAAVLAVVSLNAPNVKKFSPSWRRNLALSTLFTVLRVGNVFAYAVTVASCAADPFSASEASDSVLVYTSLLLYVVGRSA